MLLSTEKPEKYYYTSNNIFEQSIDVYRPTATAIENKSGTTDAVVALVVGSAWLGHRSFVYSPTSWWNSSGPKSISELGHVCICIRHRGSFMKTLSILTLVFVVAMSLLIMAFVNTLINYADPAILSSWVGTLESMLGGKVIRQEVIFILLFATGLLLIHLGGVGAAKYDDMTHDVMTALKFIDTNSDKLGLKCCGEHEQSNPDAKSSKKRLFIFGGYSSGGHVASVVTQNNKLWNDYGLAPPHLHCDSLLFISPVLATKSYHEVVLKKISSLSSTTSLPSLSPSDTGSSEHQILTQQSSSSSTDLTSLASSYVSSSYSPTWLTDQVVKAVFGQQASNIPSPVHTYDKSPPIPHIFLGCKNEMFGLNWLDTFFASPSYSELIASMGIESRYTAVQSDHWNILASNELRDHLRKELKRIGGKGQ